MRMAKIVVIPKFLGKWNFLILMVRCRFKFKF
jgi:hypothetical protein